ncbi:hypothetical protein DICPUDRAFT_37893 [Dictyostelium purpureum]|uniref:Uncharacterized protein n=1 Tax=Dictyostelium purpureum TaxID=5786 RepID=F0ZTL1_DICPU|nr:uncharacterized protein DICPUDRAFT_37893 [Dictyostelium purpureum]EGC32727.1 hypothetical protein DICPUDRAFT_37893 [Dictyostelium purpureum]|eukprot:XP_003290760.1 hypothetical protein DICPUDRAFT_37893 [Dictyostelium purpureum]
MVKFNKNLTCLTLKPGYSALNFQDFCQMNLDSSITKLTISNQQFPAYLIFYFNLFIKNNSNITTLNLNQSFNLLDLESIFKTTKNKDNIETLTIHISENCPLFNNSNYLFYLLSNENNSIKNLNLKIFYYFQGFKLSLIDSKDFNLISQKDDFNFKFLRNK